VPGTAAGWSARHRPARKGTAGCQNTPYTTYDLGHLGLPTTGPPTAPARLPAPTEASLWQDDVPELQQALR